MCRQEPHKVQQRQVQSPDPGQEYPHAAGEAVAQVSGEQLGSTAAPRHCGRHWVRLSVSQHCALAMQNASSLLGCTGNSTVSRSSKATVPLIQPC